MSASGLGAGELAGGRFRRQQSRFRDRVPTTEPGRYTTHSLEPTRTIPLGPLLDWDEPHGR